MTSIRSRLMIGLGLFVVLAILFLGLAGKNNLSRTPENLRQFYQSPRPIPG